MVDTNGLVIYRNVLKENLLCEMVRLYEFSLEYKERECTDRSLINKMYDCMYELIDIAGKYGFEDNLWHSYLAFLLVNDENVFSTACEVREAPQGTILSFAKHDYEIFAELFAFDLSVYKCFISSALIDSITNYKRSDNAGKVYNMRIRDHICQLGRDLANAENLDAFTDAMTSFYSRFGVGTIGLHKAFRIVNDGTVKIVPINNIAHVKLDDLVGYESAKQKLVDNTEAFLKGKPANNCLLFGDAGTGKSSSIKAILNRYYEDGLRIIEIYKHQLQELNEVIAQVKKRQYKFIIYMDDLSFEEFEVEYKYLKAVIEGGLEKKPRNVLIYATSNRRHLIKEEFSDREGWNGDLHKTDTVQEKLSLVNRFGVTIYFGSPDKKEFNNIVCTLAKRCGLNIDEKELIAQANRWELEHGGLSGRTAQQFIDYLLGKW